MRESGILRAVFLFVVAFGLAGCPKPIKMTDEFKEEWSLVLKNQPLVAEQYTYQQQQLAAIALGANRRINTYEVPSSPEFAVEWNEVVAQHPRIAGEYAIQQRYLLDLLRSARTPVTNDIGFGRCQVQNAVHYDLCRAGTRGRDGLFIRQSFCLRSEFELTNIGDCFEEQMRCANAGEPGGGGLPSEACSERFQKCITKQPVEYATGDNPVAAACAVSVASQNICGGVNNGSTQFATSSYECVERPYTAVGCAPKFSACLGNSDENCFGKLAQCLAPNDIYADGHAAYFPDLPWIFFKLTHVDTGQHYPIGGPDKTLYALYDSGIKFVRLNNAIPHVALNGNFGSSDYGHLSPPLRVNQGYVNILINGLDQRNANGVVPFNPVGEPDGAQAGINNIGIGVWDPNVGGQNPRNPTLIGGSVVKELVALIDYGHIILDVTGHPDPPQVRGSFSQFFMPGDPSIPKADVELQLEMFGNNTYSRLDSQATPGRRFWLKNISMYEDGRVVSDSGSSPFTFMIDTATDVTLVNNEVADALGLVAGQGTFGCHGGNNGFKLDRVIINGEKGNYILSDANVCRAEHVMAEPRNVNVVVGGNFFTQVKIVLNGPNETLGLIRKSEDELNMRAQELASTPQIEKSGHHIPDN